MNSYQRTISSVDITLTLMVDVCSKYWQCFANKIEQKPNTEGCYM